MCVAVPLKVISVQGREAVAGWLGNNRTVYLDLVQDVAPGDFVLVHAGFAIAKLDPDEALKTLELLEAVIDEA